MNAQFSSGLLRGAVLATITAGGAFAAGLGLIPALSNRALLAIFLSTFFTALTLRLGEAGYDSSRAKVGALQAGDVGFRELTTRRVAMQQAPDRPLVQPQPRPEQTQQIPDVPRITADDTYRNRPQQTQQNPYVDPLGTRPGR